MKFVALALTILLAAGCQARTMQADAPTQFDQMRTAFGVYVGQVKEIMQNALNHLDDTEFRDYKVKLSKSLDYLGEYMNTVGPYSESIRSQFFEAIANIREFILTDIKELRITMGPKAGELFQVLGKHMAEYRKKIAPLVMEYFAKTREEVNTLRKKMIPIIVDLGSAFEINVEETKTKLMPIVDDLYARLTMRLGELKTFVSPYAEEYKDEFFQAVGEVKDIIVTGEIPANLAPYVDFVTTKMYAFYQYIFNSMNA